VMGLLQGADVAPTTQGVAAAADRTKALGEVLARWDKLRGETLSRLNALLQQAGLPAIVVRVPKDMVEREGPDDF